MLYNATIFRETYFVICFMTDIDDCSPNPCASTGSCLDGIAAWTCSCNAGWTGTTCSAGNINIQGVPKKERHFKHTYKI